jgi:rod shape-determining protein MreC
MLKRQHYIALGAVTLATLLILSLPSRATLRLKVAIGSLFLPLFGLASSAQQFPIAAADAILPRHELLRQLEMLRHDNEQSQIQALQAAALEQENDQLRALLGWQRQEPWKVKLANVVMRDPANWWRTVQIDLGSRDGVRENLPVLTADGLVGRVSSVSYTHAQVVLIGDPDCKVSVLVEDPAHDMGIITPGGTQDSSFVKLSYLSGSAALKPGQNVVTSGIGGIYPKGIPVGQIVDAEQIEFGLYTEGRVKVAANLGSLEQVGVLFP